VALALNAPLVPPDGAIENCNLRGPVAQGQGAIIVQGLVVFDLRLAAKYSAGSGQILSI
jgi:hypothetical protein